MIEQYKTKLKKSALMDKLKTIEALTTKQKNIGKAISYVTNSAGKYILFTKSTKVNNEFVLIHPSNVNRQWDIKVEDNIITVESKLTLGSFINKLFPGLIIAVIINSLLNFNTSNFVLILLLITILIVSGFLNKIANKKIKKTLDTFISENLF